MIGDVPEAQSNAFLPAFYVNLDIAGLPTANAPDSSFSGGATPVSRAWVSVQSIYALDDVPEEAFLELWPNFWKWVQFFHTHYDRLPYQDEEDNNLESIICLDFLSFLSRLPPSGGVFQMLLTTPGVVRLITRAWFFRLKEVDPDLDEGYPALVHLLFQNRDKMTSTTIQEMIDAAGGTHAHLASLVVSYIDAVLPGHTDFMTSKELYLLFHLVDFVTTVDDIVDGRTLSHYRQALGTFAAALLPFGITRALANVAYGLIHQNGMKGFDTLLRQCLILLIRILGDSRASPFLRACDNVRCGRICEKALLKRCTACLSFYYCSRECQRIDWREGGHREACSPSYSFRLGAGDFSVRERLFMRAVLARDYEAAKWTTVYPQQVTFMAAHPGATYFTLFDYRARQVKITVNAISAPHGGGPDWDAWDGPAAWEALVSSPEWINDTTARLANSGYKLQLHVMAVAKGAHTSYVVVPLRTNDVETYQALARIASTSPRSGNISDLVHGVKMSRARVAGVVEIH
ncbi:hypothetical protein B0H13DRAFT_2343628 [Mycena leptocephala]|nr:hypothetical protein B0H13DRAFT_2343628 [Mycena leptocephala]